MSQYYEIEEYLDDNEVSPFSEWFLALKDKRAQQYLIHYERHTKDDKK
jgi:hypothetical protein